MNAELTGVINRSRIAIVRKALIKKGYKLDAAFSAENMTHIVDNSNLSQGGLFDYSSLENTAKRNFVLSMPRKKEWYGMTMLLRINKFFNH